VNKYYSFANPTDRFDIETFETLQKFRDGDVKNGTETATNRLEIDTCGTAAFKTFVDTYLHVHPTFTLLNYYLFAIKLQINIYFILD